jgi:hypothetical protein
MAKKFGGKFSPSGDASKMTPVEEAALDERRVDAAGAKAGILFVPPLILAFTSLGGGAVVLVTGLVSAAVLVLAAWMLREGLRAEAAYDARKVARRPALPRKIIATVLTGLGIGGAAMTGDAGLVGSVLYGLAAAGLHLAAFGIDPLADKRIEGIDTFQQDRVARVVDEAEDHLEVIRNQIGSTNDRALQDKVEDFLATARKMIRTVEEDPRDLTGARKYLGVYLLGARDATVKFVDLWNRKKDPEARAAYEELLDDLQKNFAQRTEKMLLDDRSDMDIEIKVLRDRLQREGV